MNFVRMSIAFLSLVTVARCLEPEIRYLRANPARGCATCTATRLEVKISHGDAKAIAVVDGHLNSPHVDVTKVELGNTSQSECLGTLTPWNRPNAHEIVTNYSSCGIILTAHADNSITYDAFLVVTVAYQIPNGVGIVPGKFAVPIQCIKNPDQNMTQLEISAEVLNVMPGVQDDFTLSISSSSVSLQKPFGVFAIDIQVVRLTYEIMTPDSSSWVITLDRVWATLNADRESNPQALYVVDGCPVSNLYAAILPRNGTSSKVQAEVAPIQLIPGQSQDLHYHAVIKTCNINGDVTACISRDCSAQAKNGFSKANNVPEFHWKQRPILVKTPAPFIRNADGTIYQQLDVNGQPIERVTENPSEPAKAGSNAGATQGISAVVLGSTGLLLAAYL